MTGTAVECDIYTVEELNQAASTQKKSALFHERAFLPLIPSPPLALKIFEKETIPLQNLKARLNSAC